MFFKEITSNLVLLFLFVLYAGSALIQLFYFWGIFSRFAFHKKKQIINNKKPISVVICAKNEYTNLKKNLPLILEQDYPNFEVVVVNDCSEDDSNFLLKSFSKTYPHLNVVTITKNINFFKGKKFALAIGIKAAKNELLILTDADCIPKSNQWISEIQKYFSDKTQIVLGYSGFEREKGLLNKIIRFDTIMSAIQYFSWAMAGKPYMGVGRNLAYNRELFFKVKGFSSHYHIPSGDDDLFINQVATKNNVAIEYSYESQTISPAKSSYHEWVIQRKRHFAAGFHYKRFHKIFLGMFSLSNFFFYLSFIPLTTFLLIDKLYNPIIIVIFLLFLKIVSQLIILKKSMNKLVEKNLLLISPILDFIFVIINPLIALSNIIVKENKWK
ncbi:MAG TPA: glycosyltransferase [Bacteroidales bacterium]|nr:glycosyltransferase [Bacteroidales bacterium]